MKKVLKIFAGVIGGIVALIIIAGVAIMLIVDKPMIENVMEKNLHRHVTIGDIKVSIFSAISGIEVKDVKISNFKTEKQLEALKNKPVDAADVFVGLGSFKFKVAFGPLLKGNVVLKELMLYSPAVNVIRYKNGSFNFSDLLVSPKMTAEEKEAKRKEMEEEAKKKAEEAKKPQKPLTADDIPVAINVGKVGMEKGTVRFTDKQYEQVLEIYNLNAIVHSIHIDPKNLAKKNSLELDINMGIKTIGKSKKGSVESFDIGLAVDGDVKVFDLSTRKLDPEASIKLGSPYGTATGLQIFEKMKDIEALSKYCGKLSFLAKDISWKNAFVKIWYKAGTVKFSEGKLATADYEAVFGGDMNIDTKKINMNADMILAQKHGDKIRKGIDDNVKKAIKGPAAKYVKPETVTSMAMKPLVNKEGLVYLKYLVKGTLTSPDPQLVHPKLPSLGDLVKEAMGEVGDMAKDLAKEKAKEAEAAAKKVADEKKAEAEKKAKAEAAKSLKKIKKPF